MRYLNVVTKLFRFCFEKCVKHYNELLRIRLLYQVTENIDNYVAFVRGTKKNPDKASIQNVCTIVFNSVKVNF